MFVITNQSALWISDNVVLPVPDKPKKTAVFSPLVLAEQCIGKIPFFGKIKFITEKMDFLFHRHIWFHQLEPLLLHSLLLQSTLNLIRRLQLLRNMEREIQ